MVYDAAGNLLSLTDPANNTTTYSYDAINRQVSDTNQHGDSATAYDATGNVTDRHATVTDGSSTTRTMA